MLNVECRFLVEFRGRGKRGVQDERRLDRLVMMILFMVGTLEMEASSSS